MSSSWSCTRGWPLSLPGLFMTLRNTCGSCRNSSILRYSCSHAYISRQGNTSKQVSLNVSTLRMDSRSNTKSSRSFKLYLLSIELGSESFSNAFSRDCLGESAPLLELSLDSLSRLCWICWLTAASLALSSSRCFFMNSSISSSSADCLLAAFELLNLSSGLLVVLT